MTAHFYAHTSEEMPEISSSTIALTVTSPPYWNAIDYDTHTSNPYAWHRNREYSGIGASFPAYMATLQNIFTNVLNATRPGGFCAVVIGTVLHNGTHYPTPMLFTSYMLSLGWEFHQDIVWNKVTGGVKRAGSYIQHPRAGYFYPNIMTEYILIFRKRGPMWRGTTDALPVDEVFKKDIANTVWHIAPVPPHTIEHPCPFPEEIARRLILLYSDPGDTILDPFLGSGQTALAAVRNGRNIVGYDVELPYIELTKERLHEMPPERTHQLVPQFNKVRREGGSNA